MGNKVKGFTVHGERAGISYRCPGCDNFHTVYTEGPFLPRWQWNGSYDRPTLSPSVNATWEGCDPDDCDVCEEGHHLQGGRCHHYVANGMIQFLPDCTHSLAGFTVPMLDREDR